MARTDLCDMKWSPREILSRNSRGRLQRSLSRRARGRNESLQAHVANEIVVVLEEVRVVECERPEACVVAGHEELHGPGAARRRQALEPRLTELERGVERSLQVRLARLRFFDVLHAGRRLLAGCNAAD